MLAAPGAVARLDAVVFRPVVAGRDVERPIAPVQHEPSSVGEPGVKRRLVGPELRGTAHVHVAKELRVDGYSTIGRSDPVHTEELAVRFELTLEFAEPIELGPGLL